MAEKPTFIMVKRQLLGAWLVTAVVLFTGILGAYQYANYVDRRSNQRWCEQLLLFNQAYKENPPTTPLGKKIAAGMVNLSNDFYCKST